MFFSVIIPVYKTEAYLHECISSVLKQSFTDYEILLLDDGSPDQSGVMCDEYKAQYPFVRVIHKHNEGLMMTRRCGFKEAKGEYFICLDSDDYLYSNRALEKIHDLIIKKNCDLVLFNYIHGSEERKADRLVRLFNYPTGYVFSSKKEVYQRLITSNQMNNMWLKCPRRDVVDADVDYSKWKDAICRAEDIFQSFPIVTNAQTVGYIDEPLYYYRWTENSISNNYKLKYYNAYCAIYKRESEYIELWDIPSEYKDCSERNYITATCKLVVICYDNYKKQGNINEWSEFVRKLSGDIIFKAASNKCNLKKISVFYRLVCFSIIHNLYFMTQFVVSVLPKVYRILHKDGVKNGREL